MEDFIDAISDAPTHASNEYWSWEPATREEYRKWYAAQRARGRPAPVQEEAPAKHVDTGDSEEEEEDDVQEDTEVQQDEPKKSKKNRWHDYIAMARDHLKKEGNPRPTMAQTTALAKAWYTDDGWGSSSK
jgi:hypothetical protein